MCLTGQALAAGLGGAKCSAEAVGKMQNSRWLLWTLGCFPNFVYFGTQWLLPDKKIKPCLAWPCDLGSVGLGDQQGFSSTGLLGTKVTVGNYVGCSWGHLVEYGTERVRLWSCVIKPKK